MREKPLRDNICLVWWSDLRFPTGSLLSLFKDEAIHIIHLILNILNCELTILQAALTLSAARWCPLNCRCMDYNY